MCPKRPNTSNSKFLGPELYSTVGHGAPIFHAQPSKAQKAQGSHSACVRATYLARTLALNAYVHGLPTQFS